MKHCETFEISLSSLIDGQLDPVELTPVIDHLVECESCRSFYDRARMLDRMVLATSAVSTSAEAAPEGVWRRIAAEAERADDSRRRDDDESQIAAGRRQPMRQWPAWATVAAAAVLLAAVLRFALPGAGTPVLPAADGGHVEVVVGRDAGKMTDQRFVALTTELLEANRRYHRKMRDVLELAGEFNGGREGSSDDLTGTENDGALAAVERRSTERVLRNAQTL